jgi:hypothetical protein
MAVYSLSIYAAVLCAAGCLFLPMFKAVGAVTLRWSQLALVSAALGLAAWGFFWFAARIIANV